MRKFWIYRASKSAIVSYTGFLIKCSILDIRQSSEYALISEYTRVVNILGFWWMYQDYTRFRRKYVAIDVWQYSEYAWDSEYATFLNMLRLHKDVNKTFHHRYLTGFWICLEFCIYQCYTGFCRKQPVILVWQVSDYSLGSQYARGLNIQGSWICQGYTWFCVNCILKIVSILNILSSEYAKVLNVSGV